ncbi:hypothetical protein HUA76_04835 [Myxococcus sp. CA056]|uniref:hypothetical protein n=1 Tax=unclassified Myxococcus TaxID=2648731 RepID=UPI00157A4569|nr:MULTISPECIES: hypothetical protein [unclassified Myxococcus]NTX10099.1 hypothetical protein [Myxococcus sp. CA056]NTX39944.1 hypothetical protein [Myxococcus sp. CA033]NTX56511.1 hypothetical protein [Myxococcus sp. CA039A]
MDEKPVGVMKVSRPWWFVAPVFATCVGLWAASAHGVRPAAFLPNLVAIVLGGAGFMLLTRGPWESHRRAERVLPVLACLAIAATLAAPGLEGVHRWWSLGPVRVNASAAFLPWLLLGVASRGGWPPWLACGLMVLVQGFHLLQPDASQATALALATLPLLVGGDFVNRRMGIPIAMGMLGLAVVTWTRSDPLAPVDHVERILVLIVSRGALGVFLAIAAMTGLLLPGLLAARSRDSRTARLGVAFVLYFAALVGSTFFGNFPVPVLGAGAGTVLGWWAMLTVLGVHVPALRE